MAIGLYLAAGNLEWGDPLIISADPHANFVRKFIYHRDTPQLLHWQVTVFEEIDFLILY